MPKGEAVKLIKKYGTNNPFEIAKRLGVVVIYEPLGNAFGYYNSYKRIKFIHINEELREKSALFVCAHELGHVTQHPKANTPFMRKNTLFSLERIEVEANTFAVELLLPDSVIYEHKHENLTINEIANIYGVPEEVAHLKNLRNVR